MRWNKKKKRGFDRLPTNFKLSGTEEFIFVVSTNGVSNQKGERQSRYLTVIYFLGRVTFGTRDMHAAFRVLRR